MPVTILEVAEARGVRANPDGGITMEQVEGVGLPFFGGCQCCGASCACYNMYPSKSGYVRCEDCIGDYGFATTEEFEAWSKADDAKREDQAE